MHLFPLQQPIPYDLVLKIVHAKTGKDITRGLQTGEYVKVILNFKVPDRSAGHYVANIRFVENPLLSIFCPHVISVGRNILWADRAVNCLYTCKRLVKHYDL